MKSVLVNNKPSCNSASNSRTFASGTASVQSPWDSLDYVKGGPQLQGQSLRWVGPSCHILATTNQGFRASGRSEAPAQGSRTFRGMFCFFQTRASGDCSASRSHRSPSKTGDSIHCGSTAFSTRSPRDQYWSLTKVNTPNPETAQDLPTLDLGPSPSPSGLWAAGVKLGSIRKSGEFRVRFPWPLPLYSLSASLTLHLTRPSMTQPKRNWPRATAEHAPCLRSGPWGVGGGGCRGGKKTIPEPSLVPRKHENIKQHTTKQNRTQQNTTEHNRTPQNMTRHDTTRHDTTQHRDRQRHTRTETQRHRETERQRDRERERQRDRETERQRDRETERQAGRQAGRQTEPPNGAEAPYPSFGQLLGLESLGGCKGTSAVEIFGDQAFRVQGLGGGGGGGVGVDFVIFSGRVLEV